MVMPSHIRLVRTVTNTLTYYSAELVTTVKSFTAQATEKMISFNFHRYPSGAATIKLFTIVNYLLVP
jgi:hypothetical protein